MFCRDASPDGVENLIPLGLLLRVSNPFLQPRFFGTLLLSTLRSLAIKAINGAYLLDFGHFLATRLWKKV